MLCGLIMAGGKGTRFWPKSTSKMPKQFLNLVGNETMIQMTFNRTSKVIPIENIFVVTCEEYKELVKEQLPNLLEKNIIIEPVGRNTAPCILLSTLYIKEMYGDVNIAVLPSDHIISEEETFANTLNEADKYLKNIDSKSIITVGINPNRPETGYGYIKALNKIEQGQVIDVERFVEKPNLENAKKYLDAGNYLWNAGMFIFNSKFMLEELNKNFESAYKILTSLPSIYDENYMKKLKEEYIKCESISIDYAVMEKSNSIKVIPADLGWDDIGTWLSLQRYIEPDDECNYIKGEVETIESSNNIIYAGDKKIILLGIDDVFCIDSDDVLIIGKKDKLSKVHEIGKRG